MKPRHASTKQSHARLRTRESALFAELCQQHGYAFADTLPARDRSTLLASRQGKKLQLRGAVIVKLMVPADGALGQQIIALREEKKK